MARFKSSFSEHQVYEDAAVLDAGFTGRLITAFGTVEAYLPDCEAVVCILETTDLQDAAGDKLDVYIQTYIGGVWLDVCHFTQIDGNDLVDAQIHIAKITASLAENMFRPTALAEGVIRNLIGTKWRCRWVITDGGGIHSFAFTVKIQPMGLSCPPSSKI